MLTSLNFPAGSEASVEAGEEEEGAVGQDGGNQAGACLPCVARVS